MKRVLFLALLAGGCGGKEGTLKINLIVSPVDDPFVDAAQVRFTVGDQQHVKSFPVSNGHFDIKIEQSPIKNPGPVLVDALDSAGNVVARGKTPPITLGPINNEVSIWVGRPERVAAAASALLVPRSRMAVAAIPPLGILYAGGTLADGSATKNTAVYDIISHEVIETDPSDDKKGLKPMSTVRTGAVAANVLGIRAVVFGGIDATGAVTNTAEVFDPTVGLGLWSPAPVENVEARTDADLTLLPSGTALISGGSDAAGTALASAALVTTTGMVRISPAAGPMAAARLHHAVAPARFSDGEGAILFGGTDGTGPVVERLVGQSFVAVEVPATIQNRKFATATQLPGGDVVVLGGSILGVPTASAVRISVAANPPVAMEIPSILSSPRARHTATRVGNDILVCGGLDDTGTALPTCDLLDGETLGRKLAQPRMGTARHSHTAAVLETGPVVLAGGIGADGAPLASMEIYTP